MTDRSESLSGTDLTGAAQQAREIADRARAAAELRRESADREVAPNDPGERTRIPDDIRTAENQAQLADAEQEVAIDLRDSAEAIRRTASDLQTTRERLRDSADELTSLHEESKTLREQVSRIHEEMGK